MAPGWELLTSHTADIVAATAMDMGSKELAVETFSSQNGFGVENQWCMISHQLRRELWRIDQNDDEVSVAQLFGR